MPNNGLSSWFLVHEVSIQPIPDYWHALKWAPRWLLLRISAGYIAQQSTTVCACACLKMIPWDWRPFKIKMILEGPLSVGCMSGSSKFQDYKPCGSIYFSRRKCLCNPTLGWSEWDATPLLPIHIKSHCAPWIGMHPNGKSYSVHQWRALTSEIKTAHVNTHHHG